MLNNILPLMNDFGLCDKVLSILEHNAKKKEIGDIRYQRRIYGDESSGITWVCFLPWRVSFEESIKYNLLPKNGKCYVYEGPIGIVNPDPQITLNLQAEIIQDLHSLNLKNFSVLGISVGTYLAFYVANHFNVNKLVAAVPGGELGRCLWTGCATPIVRRLSEKKHRHTHESYDNFLKGTNPMENITNLPCEIDFYYGGYDRIITTENAERLLHALVQNNKKVRTIKYTKKGHVLTLLQFGLEHPY